jgi:hypothetical protein
MSTSNHNPLVAENVLEELSARGQAIYDKLKSQLEPEHNNKFVAVHVDTGDYAIARSSGDAMRAMHKLHPDSRLFIRKIGDEPEYGLTARILASDMPACIRNDIRSCTG